MLNHVVKPQNFHVFLFCSNIRKKKEKVGWKKKKKKHLPIKQTVFGKLSFYDFISHVYSEDNSHKATMKTNLHLKKLRNNNE